MEPAAAADALPPYELGFPRTDMRRKLVEAVLSGAKTATASLRAMYEPFTKDPLPRSGGRFSLVGYSDEPLGAVEVTGVSVVPLDEVDLEFAVDEGEGYTTIAEWRAAARESWPAYNVTGTTLVVCERFRFVGPDGHA